MMKLDVKSTGHGEPGQSRRGHLKSLGMSETGRSLTLPERRYSLDTLDSPRKQAPRRASGERIRRKSEPGPRRASETAELRGRRAVPLHVFEKMASALTKVTNEEVRIRSIMVELDAMAQYFDRVKSSAEDLEVQHSMQRCIEARERIRECLRTEALKCSADAVEMKRAQTRLNLAYREICAEAANLRSSSIVAGALFNAETELDVRAAAAKVTAAYERNFLPREVPFVNGRELEGERSIANVRAALRDRLREVDAVEADIDLVRRVHVFSLFFLILPTPLSHSGSRIPLSPPPVPCPLPSRYARTAPAVHRSHCEP